MRSWFAVNGHYGLARGFSYRPRLAFNILHDFFCSVWQEPTQYPTTPPIGAQVFMILSPLRNKSCQIRTHLWFSSPHLFMDFSMVLPLFSYHIFFSGSIFGVSSTRFLSLFSFLEPMFMAESDKSEDLAGIAFHPVTAWGNIPPIHTIRSALA